MTSPTRLIVAAMFVSALVARGQQGYPAQTYPPQGYPSQSGPVQTYPSQPAQGSPYPYGPSYPPEAGGQYPQGQPNGYPDGGGPYDGTSGAAGNPEQPDPADQQHGVARLSFLGGDVNLQRAGSSDLVAAVINAPLLSSDRLQTAPGASAEVQLDGSTVMRLAQNSDINFAELQWNRARIQIGGGTMIFRVLRETPFAVDLETPSIAVHPLGPADLRVSVLENGTTQIAVRAGAADIYGPAGTQRLEAPRTVLVRANTSGPEFQDIAAPPADPFDGWSASRDSALLASPSYQYTGGDMAGIGDLDANGSWVNSSQYGPVWQPRIADAGWAPYSDGQWVNEPYYGWTWVDASPWGWAPFHYGRWFWNTGHGWCWWPGARGLRHAWGPAYVGFFGYGGGGSLGWVALAPYERFNTWWGRGGYRGNGFYAPGGVLGSYRNAAFRGAAIGGSFATFSNWRGRFGAVPRDSFARGTVIRGQLPVNSSNYRFHFVDRPAVSNQRFSGSFNRSFVQSPGFRPGAYPSSGFGSSGPAFRGAQGSTAGNQWHTLQTPGPGYRNSPGGNYRPAQPYRTPSAGAPGASAGWQHFGDPRVPAGSGYRQGFTSPGRNESGWHQFGQPNRTAAPPQNSYRAQPYSPPSGYRNFSGGGQSGYRPAPSNSGGAPRNFGGGGQFHSSGPAPSAPRGGGYSGGGGSHGGGNSHSGNGGGGGHHR